MRRTSTSARLVFLPRSEAGRDDASGTLRARARLTPQLSRSSPQPTARPARSAGQRSTISSTPRTRRARRGSPQLGATTGRRGPGPAILEEADVPPPPDRAELLRGWGRAGRAAGPPGVRLEGAGHDRGPGASPRAGSGPSSRPGPRTRPRRRRPRSRARGQSPQGRGATSEGVAHWTGRRPPSVSARASPPYPRRSSPANRPGRAWLPRRP